jgi:hypothetical protein
MRTVTIDIGPHLLSLALLWTVYGLFRIVLTDRRVRTHRPGSSREAGEPVPAPADRRAAPRPSTQATANAPTPDIVTETCRIVGGRYNVTVEELLSPTRTQPIALARQVAMRLLRELTDLSYPQIAARFNRDHSKSCTPFARRRTCSSRTSGTRYVPRPQKRKAPRQHTPAGSAAPDRAL